MSLILEALRKSEAERRRGLGPDLHAEAAPPAARPRPPLLPAWAWWLPVLLIALAVVAWRWSLPHAAVSASTGIASTPRPAPALPPVPRLVRQPQPVSSPAPTTTLARTTPARTVTADGAMPKPAEPPRPATPKPVAPTTPASDRPLPLSDLAPDERKALPPLRLSMHLWNDDPSRRFVILDGTRLHEGDRIGDLVVTAINRDGVVLDWNGRKLGLPIE